MAAPGEKTVSRLPRTDRGRATRERLLHGAEEVFRERGYKAASVSAICRRAGLAQGTFYLYFVSKEEVYVNLVEALQNDLVATLRSSTAPNPDPRAQLIGAYDALLDFISENAGLFQVFREAEFVRPEIPKRFYAAVCAELISVLEAGIAAGAFRDLDPEVVAYAVLGAVFFLAVRYVMWEGRAIPPEARRVGADLIRQGIAGDRSPIKYGGEPASGSVQDSAAAPSPQGLEGGEATRHALLIAAERAFGQAGFHQTTISTITYLAGVGQGTFYIHFPSKVAIFSELVREISREFRYRQSLAVAHHVDRRAVEAEGFRSFLRWVRDHPGAYRIVREAEFVDENVGKWYYTRLAQGYARGLSAGMNRGEIRRCDPEVLAYTLLGIGHFAGQRWELWGGEKPAEKALPDLISLILYGALKEPHATKVPCDY
ncbi:MAG: TetR/AcrR family transcriptional regulator [Candidatus Bipolaricaulis anaerobius]|jgi:AcrR family transcriptional regulator|uniref:TetR family transcriptional regulator n=1 Tax=Candidatus Bipolaricaulis anaerobius TaxID=2026885 RepID=A0A2X3MLS7_9BACT|nr:TetR/AcrR family transcriptional regulator [Candidatus Bipolaricaulis anaerobius]MBP7726047.1 TetR/AcrR family transcriptional regulator [Candidatus Bipolaricaulis sp.]MDD3748854.1 TetR/AcrR family transcriptional regulator [Candidatus Bipolaricaulis anaerobius]MDD5763712.1 TetR/AcrR family transcriptional regulator [Candidatus Bipolaricaulis anaerobius]SQD93095.1 TetR family transcriptional regulator [Candidatus Bipolaricaulis anaerobius]